MRQLKGVLLAMISSSTFGLIPLFALPAMQEGVGLDSVLFYRFAISAVVVGAYLLLRRVDLRITLKEFGTMFLLGGEHMLLLRFSDSILSVHSPTGWPRRFIFFIRCWLPPS